MADMNSLGVPYRVSFAQNREDIFLDYFFKDIDKGFYVDVGANDPTADSVTKIFYDKGWSGINIEPIKTLFNALEVERPRDINLNIGISSSPGKTMFREFHEYHGLSTMSPEMHQKYSNDAKKDEHYADFTDIEVSLDTLKNIFTYHKVETIHFMKVDVEGYEYDVLAGNDWDKFRPEIICIEANHIVNDWRPLLQEQGYLVVFNDGLNDYYASKEAKTRADSFSYVQAVLPTPVVTYPVANAINSLVAQSMMEKNALVFRNSELSLKVGELNHRLMVAESELHESKRFIKIVRNLIFKIDQLIEERIYPSIERHKLHKNLGEDSVPLEESVKEQAAAIQKYDAENLHNIRLGSNTRRMALLRTYRVVKKPIKWTLLLGWKSLKWVKRRLRG